MAKTQFACSDCGSVSPKWAGKCSDCGGWNTMTEMAIQTAKNPRQQGYAGEEAKVVALNAVAATPRQRISTQIPELDRVLGGGLVEGSVTLIGGDPGIGKSTLLLQTLTQLPTPEASLYVTGEESLHQVSLRAKRLGSGNVAINLLSETQVESIIKIAQQIKPQIMVIDSIQTVFTDTIQSAPGSVSQVRESAAHLVRFAKQTGISLFLVGHVNKEGSLAGPRVLEHMVDTVFYFDGQQDSRYRVIRALKNRFGAVNELGIFAMTDKGLRTVSNPSAIFLSQDLPATSGTIVMAMWEGSRPMLIEIQALVDESHLEQPRRVTVGYEPNRLALLLAVLSRHGKIPIYKMDVFLNVVGGVKVLETGADLAVLLAVVSSFKNVVLDKQTIVFGEIGLGSEVRPVQGGVERINEAAKHGFKRAIVPKANAPRNSKLSKSIEIIAVESLQDAIRALEK